ncbi:hypothetical protein Csa_014447 [Cucumis sativus]|uniref:Uncharacterized protein n=1 Tax=Cucumis sativus TaxID=3659 RepID=A0A0A0KZF3_CUCSA|nr:hypothetical protein Csa_014447 [Cucumis sativus]
MEASNASTNPRAADGRTYVTAEDDPVATTIGRDSADTERTFNCRWITKLSTNTTKSCCVHAQACDKRHGDDRGPREVVKSTGQ